MVSRNVGLKKLILLSIFLLGALFLCFYIDLQEGLNFISENKQLITSLYIENKVIFSVTFLFLYVFVTMFSIPASIPLTMFAGSIFGMTLGVAIVSLASTLGATLAFLISRYFFRESFELVLSNRYPTIFEKIDKGIKKHGSLYLLFLRLIPVFPFFLVNIIMGLTNVKTYTFFIYSLLGMLSGTIVYVNAGLVVGSIDTRSYSDIILDPSTWLSLLLIGFFVIISRRFKHIK